MAGQVGKRLPAHCTALGKALLSGVSKKDLSLVFGERVRLSMPTGKTVSTVSKFYEEVARVRHTGLAVDDEELYPGVSCVASPVRDHLGRIVAAVSVSFPKNRVDSRRLGEFQALLLESASEFSRRLGSQAVTQRGTAFEHYE